MSLVSDILPNEVARFESVESITPALIARILSGDRSAIPTLEDVRMADGTPNIRESKILVISLVKELARLKLADWR